MEQSKIDRINELYRKSKAEGLTEAEKKEQALLRKQFVADVKKNLTAQLNNIDIQNEDGTIENLGEKYGNKSKEAFVRNILPSEMPCCRERGGGKKRCYCKAAAANRHGIKDAQEIFAYYPLKE